MNPSKEMEPYKRTSMFLCKVLRHQPGLIGISLDSEGWTDIDTLIKNACEKGHIVLNRDILNKIIKSDAKGRYEVDVTGKKIRCCHGHSVDIDLSSTKATPPPTLFHGTAQRFVNSIQSQGLISKGRQFVHLSEDRTTAETVGSRHEHEGHPPVVFLVDSSKMSEDGYDFFLSHDGVWLTKAVPAKYLSIHSHSPITEEGKKE
eukprot:gnl/Chilomastix_caulleri/2812.p1 GENE.gnl/Chilomastix_caulleri/2812~~gnl/Chilomastix_caulleri/2812.p1  ORF type:complete len:203 (-),score=34.40 gnl/Chilomastix_caulleri/2812:46-654(-)